MITIFRSTFKNVQLNTYYVESAFFKFYIDFNLLKLYAYNLLRSE